jgi:hypothetical protein
MSGDLKTKLQFGCYHANLPQADGSVERVLCKPLSQADYAEGWEVVLPKRKKKSTIYNWNVNLAQLPPYLWNRCHHSVNEEGKYIYTSVRDGIYSYNVTLTEFDGMMRDLYKEIERSNKNYQRIQELYEQVKQQTSGWLVMRAKKVLLDG